MANTFTCAKGLSKAAGGTIHTVPGGTTAIIIGVRVTGLVDELTHVTVEVGGTKIGRAVPIPAGGGYEFIEPGSKVVALTGDTVVVTSDADNDCDVYVSMMAQT